MKIAVCAAETPQWPKMDWVAEAIAEAGHTAIRCRKPADLEEVMGDCHFIILAQKSIAGRWPNMKRVLKRRPCPAVYWWFDLVAIQPGLELVRQAYFSQWKELFQEADVCLVKEQSLLDEYTEAGVNAVWFDQGCPSNMPAVDWDSEKEFDLLVWGQIGHYEQRRYDATFVAKSGHEVAWVGSQDQKWAHGPYLPQFCPPFELHKQASRSLAVLSCGRRNDIRGYWSDSFWMAMGMGCCVIRKATPGLPEGPYLMYHDHAQLEGIVRRLKSRPEEARDLGEKARQWVMQNHTIRHRIDGVIQIVRSATGVEW